MRSDDTAARGACLAVAKVAAVSDGSPTMTAPRTVTATRYVTPLREGGSMPGLVEADDDGLYVLKFRGAGQGPKALVAELVAGELAPRARAAGARARARRARPGARRAPSPTPRSRS